MSAAESGKAASTQDAPLQDEAVQDDLELLLEVMPPPVREALRQDPRRGQLIEVILDLGRLPEARFPGEGVDLGKVPVSREQLAAVVERVGTFGPDNRAGIEATLHRISALRNRLGDIIGLTCRVGRAVEGTVDIIRDVIDAGDSILLLGRPGVGKTTLLREAARVLAGPLAKRVVVVDTSNEIAGDSDVPHHGIGRARRMQVATPERQHAVMIEAVENHMPEVIVIDEIGTEAEALAARTIAERGVQLIATAHGNSLDNLLQNPTLSDLVGGIQAVTLSDEEARRRGTRKTVLERKSPPTFNVVVEIQAQDRLAVHHYVADVVDMFLRGVPPGPELRRRTEDGKVEIESASSVTRDAGDGRLSILPVDDRPLRGHGRLSPWKGAARAPAAFATRSRGGFRGAAGRGRPAAAAPMVADNEPTRAPTQLAGRGRDAGSPVGRRRRRILRLFPYALSRNKLERAIRDLGVPVRLVNEISEADLMLTLKSQERRQPKRLRDAELRGTRLEVVKSNTVKQLENFLRTEFQLGAEGEAHGDALAEVEKAVDAALDEGRPVELLPQDRVLRRLQHEMIQRYGLASESRGEEPHRRVVVYPG